MSAHAIERAWREHFGRIEPKLVCVGLNYRTPAGVGVFRDPRVSLRPGDDVEIEVEGIGVLRNPVVAEE
jgi:2-keto-4-pentenoate hydratase/2-oxohepta-3-ene-1,7-dioic acid hydratase in catechol pathway